jgi:hypothetical protein
MRSAAGSVDDLVAGRSQGDGNTMSDNDDGKLPARSRKPVDAEAQAARASAPALDLAKLRDVQKAMEQNDDGEG